MPAHRVRRGTGRGPGLRRLLSCVAAIVLVAQVWPAAAARELDPKDESAQVFRVGLGVYREISAEKGAVILARAAKLDPTNALCAIYLAEAIYATGDRNAANEVAAEIPKLVRDRALLYFYKGKRAQLKGDEEAALYDFRESVLIEPTEHAFYEMAALEIEQGDLDAAEIDLTIGLKLFPNDYYLHNLMGGVRHRQKRYDEALDEFNEAILNNSTLPWARVNRGLTYTEKGKYDKALKDFDAVLKMYPDQDRAKFFKAHALEKMKRYGAARDIIDELAKAKPLDAGLWLAQGWLYYKTDKVREGQGLLEKYVEQMPDDPEGHYKLATLFAGRRKSRDAFAKLRRALELNRVDTMLWMRADAEWDRYRDTKKFKALLRER